MPYPVRCIQPRTVLTDRRVTAADLGLPLSPLLGRSDLLSAAIAKSPPVFPKLDRKPLASDAVNTHFRHVACYANAKRGRKGR
jgi:hypothetical protein